MSHSNRFRRPALAGTLSLLVVLLLFANPASPAPLSAREGGYHFPTAEADGSRPDAAQFWFGWDDLGTPPGKNVAFPVVGQHEDGRLEVFAADLGSGGNMAIHHRAQIEPNGAWGDWTNLDGVDSGRFYPSVIRNADGRLEVFALHTWRDVTIPRIEASHIFQTAPNGAWGSWDSIGQPNPGSLLDLEKPYAGRNEDGRLAIFTKGEDKNIWLTQQTGAGVNTWTNWANLGRPSVGISTQLSVGWEQDERLDVFATGGDNAIFHITQDAPNGSFGSWVSLGKPGLDLGYPAAYRNEDGRQEVYAPGTNGNIYHKFQLDPNGAWVASWGNLGRPTGVKLDDLIVIAGRLPGGEQCIFAEGDDENVWARCQLCPNCNWDTWYSLGKPTTLAPYPHAQFAFGNNANGNPILFVVGEDGHLWANSWIEPFIVDPKTKVYLPMVRR